MINGNSRLILVSFIALLCTTGCASLQDEPIRNIKDLDENMIDLRMYHENLGDAIVKRDKDDAEWLLEGMDSVLRVVAGKFDEHRKLDRPFSESYRRNLEPSIDSMRVSLRADRWENTGRAYTILTRKCNGCHRDVTRRA